MNVSLTITSSCEVDELRSRLCSCSVFGLSFIKDVGCWEVRSGRIAAGVVPQVFVLCAISGPHMMFTVVLRNQLRVFLDVCSCWLHAHQCLAAAVVQKAEKEKDKVGK